VQQAPDRVRRCDRGRGARTHGQAPLSVTKESRADAFLTPKQIAPSLDEDTVPFGLETGLALMDSSSPVLSAGRLVVLAGRPGIGKTTLASAIIVRNALASPSRPTPRPGALAPRNPPARGPGRAGENSESLKDSDSFRTVGRGEKWAN
jgi:hypothetical protein